MVRLAWNKAIYIPATWFSSFDFYFLLVFFLFPFFLSLLFFFLCADALSVSLEESSIFSVSHGDYCGMKGGLCCKAESRPLSVCLCWGKKMACQMLRVVIFLRSLIAVASTGNERVCISVYIDMCMRACLSLDFFFFLIFLFLFFFSV